MPAFNLSRPDSSDVWHRHASEIRKLYRNNTIENVKRFMEKERDFPELALEDPTRLRGDLKLKRTRKKTEIIVRNRTYTWEKAWKNMKSAGAIGRLPQLEGPLSPLPLDIVIRTPLATPPSSPSPPSILPISLDRERASGAMKTQEISLISCDRVPSDQEIHERSSGNIIAQMPFDHQGTEVLVLTAEHAEVIWNLCITGLPIEQLVAYTVENTNFAAPPRTTLQGLLPLRNPSFPPTNLPFEFEPPWKITHQFLSAVIALPSNGLSTFTYQRNYIRLFMVIYAVSNNLVQRFTNFVGQKSAHPELLRNLDLVFADVPGNYLEALLYKRLASIRAALETFLDLAATYDQRGAFQFLVKVGATYGWLASSWKDHKFLSFAAWGNMTSALRTLLDNGCRPDSWIPDPKPPLFRRMLPLAIVTALIRGNLECAQLLLEHCDVNKYINSSRGTNFEFFLQEVDKIGKLSEIGLKLFLQAGADLEQTIYRPTLHWDCRSLSAMDYLFYFDRSLFHTLPSTSARVRNGDLSGAGILLSLEGGVQSLETYLGTITPQPNRQQLYKVLKRLIIEQFLVCDLRGRKRDTALETVHALVNFGVRFGAGIKNVLRYSPDILHEYVQLVGDDCDAFAIEAALYLVENGATVTGEVLSWMARLPDTRPFDLLLGSIKDLKGLHIAIAHAAVRNNFTAIDRLLHAGAKLDTDFWDSRACLRHGTSIISKVILNYRPKSGRLQMLDFLVERGAPLRLSKLKPHLHHLLQLTLEISRWDSIKDGEIMDVVQYIFGAGYDLQNSPFPTAPLLEACGRTRVFEYLYRNGAQLRPGSPLARWIGIGGGIELCREMLKAGAEPNAYFRDQVTRVPTTPLQAAARECSIDIVELLFQAGSDVNAPAKGERGYTALQASCSSRPDFLEFQEQKLRTIRLLLAHGANVNAAPASFKGKTALQEAAASGDVAVAKLLLLHNPRADVNAPPCVMDYRKSSHTGITEPVLGTALDFAAENGRIDMVKLLLNCNALSHHQGKTGYDGAIDEARNGGHFAVADLIHQHAEDAKWSGASPDLLQPRRNHHDYEFEWGPYENSLHSEDYDDSLYAEDLTAEDWKEGAVGVLCSRVDQGDHQAAAHDHETSNMIHSLASADCTTATADEDNAGHDQGVFNFTQDEDVMAIWPCQSPFQLVGCGASIDFDVSFGGGAGQDVIGQYSNPWVLENGDIHSAACIELLEIDVHEVGEDDE